MENALGLDLSFGTLMAGFVFGVLGAALFVDAKKKLHYPNMAVGAVMVIYPYFVRGAWLNWFVGFALCGAAYYLHKNHIP